MDKIIIKNMVVEANIGVSQEERSKKQRVIINSEIQLKLKNNIINDEISKTIDYSKIRSKILIYFNENEHKLLETFANNIADLLFNGYDKKCNMNNLKLRLSKPDVFDDIEEVCVEVTRKRE